MIRDHLAHAPLEVIGRFATASNATLLCRVGTEPTGMLAVYKPAAGETPLWDFPAGTLHRREMAAFVVDRLLGWNMVPETVVRADAPYGPGSVQRFVEHDPARHYFVLVEEGHAAITEQLLRMVAFDLIVNNADRKAGHVLVDEAGMVRLVDHGVCFHAEDKVRTVAWDFAGERVPDGIRTAALGLEAALDEPDASAELRGLLEADEIEATARRARTVAELDRFPAPSGPRPFPWPAI